ncbi:FxSxx-COOH system tetratricopeptide repeat protein [Streptomyces sp. NPDC050803]|uniref:FxSxx-COOH system tetratricopeptide repeat protein n=1 Tax=unclassified Streptomyces TaxID=2593676 RepID=UPI0034211EA0
MDEIEVVSGELVVPLGDPAGALAVGLAPLAAELAGERRDLAVELRQCFAELRISVRGYAAKRRYKPSSVSRYLSGHTVAPDHFVAALVEDVGRKLGRPMSLAARNRLTDLQRAALKTANPRAWQVQVLEDKLAAAVQEMEVARTQADALATVLHTERERFAGLEAERQELAATVAAQRASGAELDVLRAEQHRVRGERDALRQRVIDLEAALAAAEQRVALAEQRCADLEQHLLAADEAATAEETGARLRAERDRARQEAELNSLRAEVDRLRAADRQARGAPSPAPRRDAASDRSAGADAAPARPQPPSLVSGVMVVYPGFHRAWAAWIAYCLERHGHRVSLQRWNPRDDVPLEEALGDLLMPGGRVLLVLNDWFFELGVRPAGEWNDVLRGFVAEHAHRFAAVNLTNRSLPSATAVLEPANLWGLSEAAAEERLLNRLELPRRRTPLTLSARVRYPETRCEIWGEVPRRNPRFTGRDELLNDLHQLLVDAEPGTAVCALLGMSGIGKTHIAAEYAHRFSSDYDVVWWVSSDDRAIQRDRLGELAVELGLRVGSEPGERVRAVRDALRRGQPYSNWLLIFDGWDIPQAAGALLPQGTGHVLITSRNRAWSEHADMLEVPAFLRGESTAYLMRRAPHITTHEADVIAAEFGDVPLPVVQAAAWLGESHMEAHEYLSMVRERRLSIVDEPVTGQGFPEASLTSWSILLNRLRQDQPRAVDVLGLCTFFAPGRIPLGLVRAHPDVELPEELRWMTTDELAWNQALDTLVAYSILTRETTDFGGIERGPSQGAVRMHRLVHDIVSRLISDESRLHHRAAVLSLLAAADPKNPADSRSWLAYAELLPHLEASGALDSSLPAVQETVLNCLRYCLAGGEYGEGARLAERIRDRWAGLMSPLSRPMLDLTDQQCGILRADGRFREAYEAGSGLLTILQEDPRRRPIDELMIQTGVAADLRHFGRYQEAHDLQSEVLGRLGRLLGPDEAPTLAARHHLGIGLRLLGRYREAYELDTETSARRQHVLGARHMSTLDSGTAVSHGLRLLGRYREALAHQEPLVRLHTQVLGHQHPQTLAARAELAMSMRYEGGRTPDMWPTMVSLLEQLILAHGREHHRTLAFLTVHGNFLREHGDLHQARELVDEAESGYRQLLGAAHPVATGMVSNSGLVRQAMGERAEAMSLFEAGLAGLTAALGVDHPWALGCALNAAGARNLNGRIEEAVELSRDTLRRARQALGEEHPFTLSCQVALASDLRAAREQVAAGRMEEDGILGLTRGLGAQHPLTIAARQRTRPYWDFEPFLG